MLQQMGMCCEQLHPEEGLVYKEKTRTPFSCEMIMKTLLVEEAIDNKNLRVLSPQQVPSYYQDVKRM